MDLHLESSSNFCLRKLEVLPYTRFHSAVTYIVNGNPEQKMGWTVVVPVRDALFGFLKLFKL